MIRKYGSYNPDKALNELDLGADHMADEDQCGGYRKIVDDRYHVRLPLVLYNI